MYVLALTKSEQDWKKLNILDKEAYASLIKAQRTGLTKYSTLNKQKIQNYAGQFSGLKDTFINSNIVNTKSINSLDLGISPVPIDQTGS